MNELSVAELIVAFHDQRISFDDIIRRLLNTQWLIPADSIENNANTPVPLFREIESTNYLLVFSDEDEFNALHYEDAPHTIRRSGLWILQQLRTSWLDTNLGAIVLNPASAAALQFTREYFDLLLRWAQIVELETALRGQSTINELAIKIRNFGSFLLPLFRTDTVTHIVLAPDDKGRQLAAIFTAPDAAKTYIDAAAQQDPDLEIYLDELDGTNLMTNLLALHADGMLDGVVFNCFGPVPVALPMSFIHHIANVEADANDNKSSEQPDKNGDWL